MPDSPEPPSSSQNSAGESSGGTALRTSPTADAAPAAGTLVQLATGMLLAERFDIGKQLGSGGMGVVFEAFDRLAQETVAIKVLREDLYLPSRLRVSRRTSHPLGARDKNSGFRLAEDG